MSGEALAVAALSGVAVALLVPAAAGARLDSVLDRAPPGSGVARRRGAQVEGRGAAAPSVLLAAVSGGLGLAVVVGGVPGLVAGVVAGVATVLVLRRLEPRAVRLHRERLAADLPSAVDLLAACLASGRPPAAALTAVVEAVGGPLAAELGPVAVRLRLGADPVAAWREVGRRGDALAVLGRTIARSLDTGAPMADGLRLLAADLRRERRAAVERRARGVGVRAAAPLGLCFLPAFVLVGIVPSIVGAFTAMSWW